MPAPIEAVAHTACSLLKPYNLNSINQWGTHEVASHMDDTFRPRDVEEAFCRDYSCCGHVLRDLHELLQHYEEYHSEDEADDDQFFLGLSHDSGWDPSRTPSTASPFIPSLASSPFSSPACSPQPADDASAATLLRKNSGAYWLDSKNEASVENTKNNSKTCSTAPTNNGNADGKKRLLREIGSPHKSFSLSSSENTNTEPVAKRFMGTKCVSLTTTQDIGEESEPEGGENAHADISKLYKCTIVGCRKTYKEHRRLKCHTSHRHGEGQGNRHSQVKSLPKPYKCSVLECRKRYKNLNGLKYHIENSHIVTSSVACSQGGENITSSD